MLIDRFGRTIDYLRISVTDRCNLRCSYCTSGQKVNFLLQSGDILSYEEILKIIDVASAKFSIRNYRLTGGEPLLRRNLVFLVKELSERKLNIGLTTNGTLLSREAEKLYAAGLRRINISLDTISPQEYKKTTGGDIAPVFSGIEKAISCGFSKIKINVVISHNDYESIDGFIEWASKYKLVIKLIEKMPFAIEHAEQNESFQNISLEKNIVRRFNLEPCTVDSFGPGRYYRSENTTLGFVSSLSAPFCLGCNRLRLTSDGRLRPCLAHNYCVDLRKILRDDASPVEDSLEKAFLEVALRKPENHSNFSNICHNTMVSIGG